MQGDNLQWYLHDGTLTISGEGEMMNDASPDQWRDYYEQITKVVVEERVTSLGFYGTFRNFRNAASFELPVSLTKIGENSFNNCPSLKDVYYCGSAEQWEEIDISDLYNDPLLSATIHFGAAAKVGDASGDGEVNAKDGILLARHIAGWTGYEVLPLPKS